ncbi:hypothetical protein ACFSSC_00370 [Corynebacterium mendelii]|uniref:Uncharacterized protein n=1 Tax=Corynebacterium mendelii TaxID=2765362 RepID=A0A939DZK9_9CORY|nr:hypothetical protein [Corynebacterium mendelii]MBN9643740.1 hypothetical protein [Corynebacterium mendelii]
MEESSRLKLRAAISGAPGRNAVPEGNNRADVNGNTGDPCRMFFHPSCRFSRPFVRSLLPPAVAGWAFSGFPETTNGWLRGND